MPEPKKGESKEDFVARFMASEEAKRSFPDEKQRLAVAYSKWRNKNKEKLDWHKFNFITPIHESAHINDNFIIRGIAISETTTYNNHKYIAEELAKAAPSLKGKPLLVDHDNRVESIKGRVTGSYFDPLTKSIQFEAKIMDKKIQEMVKDGRISSVSIGAFSEDLIRDEESGSLIARGLQIVELSLVAVPADENANFAVALSQNYSIKESLEKAKEEDEWDFEDLDDETEEQMIKCPECGKEMENKAELKKHMMDKHNKMEMINTDERRLNEMAGEKESKVDEKYDSILLENKSLLEKINTLEEHNQALIKEKKLSLVESYKKLCAEKGVNAKELTNASEETIRFLIEQLNDIKVAKIEEKPEFKANVSEKLPEEMTNFVIEEGTRGIAVWEMPNVENWRKNHFSIARVKHTW